MSFLKTGLDWEDELLLFPPSSLLRLDTLCAFFFSGVEGWKGGIVNVNARVCRYRGVTSTFTNAAKLFSLRP